jgi:NAD(P)H-nitrite reductase large subunit
MKRDRAIDPSFFISHFFINKIVMSNKKPFHIIPEINMSLASQEEMKKITATLKRFDITFFKITAGHHLALYEINKNQLEELRKELFKVIPHAPTISVNYVHSCPSIQQCKYATRESRILGRRIEQFSFYSPLPNKIKVGIAACQMCCTEPYLRDIGIIGSRKGWKLIFGGNGGSKPRIGDVIAEGLNDDQLFELITSCITVYRQLAGPKQRTARLIEQIGIEAFISKLHI